MKFSEFHLIDDLRRTAKILGAPFSEPMVQRIAEAYSRCFSSGAVILKTTSRPGDELNLRFFPRKQVDTTGIALRAGLLREQSTGTRFIRLLSDVFDGTESCGFDMTHGMVKTWVYLGGVRPVEEMLDTGLVPSAVRQHLPAFHRIGLDYARFVAVDHRQNKANLYFRTTGPSDQGKCERILGLVGVASPSHDLVNEIRHFVPQDFCLAVTVSLETGTLERACFYALKRPVDQVPEVPERLKTFLLHAPNYDRPLVQVLGWSFGHEGDAYLQAAKSYCGDVAEVLADTDCYLNCSAARGPLLAEMG